MDSVSSAPLSGTNLDPFYGFVRSATSRFDVGSHGLFDALLQVTELSSKQPASIRELPESEVSSRPKTSSAPSSEPDDFGAEVDRESEEKTSSDLASPFVNLAPPPVQSSVIYGETPKSVHPNAFTSEPLDTVDQRITADATAPNEQNQNHSPSDQAQFLDQENSPEQVPLPVAPENTRPVEGTVESASSSVGNGVVEELGSSEQVVHGLLLKSESETEVAPDVLGSEIERASATNENSLEETDHDGSSHDEARRETRRRDRRGLRLRDPANVELQTADGVRKSADLSHPGKDIPMVAAESSRPSTAMEPAAALTSLPLTEGPLPLNSAFALQIAPVSRSIEGARPLNGTTSTVVNSVTSAKPSNELALPNRIRSSTIPNTPESVVRASGTGSDAANNSTTDVASSSTVDRVRLIQRVSKAFQRIGDHGGNIRIRLSPPSLGAVQVEIRLKETVMNARLVTETEAARSAIQEHLAELQVRLKEQGIQIERIDVEKEPSSTGSFLGSGTYQQSWSDTESRTSFTFSRDRAMLQSSTDSPPHHTAKLSQLDVQA